MASRSGQVTLRGRFSVGSVVTLTRVAGEGTLRAEGGEDVETKTVVEEDGVPRVGFVRFSKGVEPGARYIIHGINDGVPLQIRVRGREAGDPSEVLEQPPVLPDRTRLSDGSWSDEAPTKESAPDVLAAQADLRHVPEGDAAQVGHAAGVGASGRSGASGACQAAGGCGGGDAADVGHEAA
jgi:hypothetical protein